MAIISNMKQISNDEVIKYIKKIIQKIKKINYKKKRNFIESIDGKPSMKEKKKQLKFKKI